MWEQLGLVNTAGICGTCSLQGPGWAQVLGKTPASRKWKTHRWPHSPALPDFWHFCPSPLRQRPLSPQGPFLPSGRAVSAVGPMNTFFAYRPKAPLTCHRAHLLSFEIRRRLALENGGPERS